MWIPLSPKATHICLPFPHEWLCSGNAQPRAAYLSAPEQVCLQEECGIDTVKSWVKNHSFKVNYIYIYIYIQGVSANF